MVVAVTIVGTNGEEFAYGSCPSAMTFFEQAEMVRQLAALRFPDQVRVDYRNLEDGEDPEIAAQVRLGRRELPLVLIDGRVQFEGGVPWQDIQRLLRMAMGGGRTE